MDFPKKRDQKARQKFQDKKNLSKNKTQKKDGVVDFVSKSDDKKKFNKKKLGDKREKSTGSAPKKFDKKPNKFQKDGDKNKSKEEQDKDEQSRSQIRRQKQKISELVKKLRINHSKLLMKKKDLAITSENKQELVKECMEMIGDKFQDLIYKHDGCRIVQAIIKHGSNSQKTEVLNQIKTSFVQLMQQKYSYHLAMKAYYYAPGQELKKYFHQQINSQIGKLVMHQYASEVIEYVYTQLATSQSAENDKVRREMVFSFYGQYFLLLKQLEQTEADQKENLVSLKTFVEKKPQLAEQILNKIEGIVQKLVEKGMSRHSIVQAIIADYVKAQTDIEKIKWLAETMKEKLPSLLASKQGLYVACAFFNVLDAKDRKLVVKSVQEPMKEMAVNKIASLFLVHILNNLDDTVISKKKIINDLLLIIDENINDKCFQNIFLGIYQPLSKRYFDQEEIEAFQAYSDKSTSKKDPELRRLELLQACIKPLEKFFEERMQFYLIDISKNPLLAKVIATRIELGQIKDSEAMDEMYRQIQKKHTYDDKLQILIGHPDLHRVIKELVKLDAELNEKKKDDHQLDFTNSISSIITKNLEACLETRATWIIVEIIEHENTKNIIYPELQKQKKLISQLIQKSKAEGKSNKGLQIIQEKLK